MSNNILAPIILFVYNRPWHTQQTIENLQKNVLADQSDLIIYSDGPKNDQAWLQVKEVRNFIENVEGFKSVNTINRNKNWGLAANVIDGVTEVVNKYGKVIVLEDDIVTSSAFLSFMNQALDFYQNENKVWHISGWNYPIDAMGLGDAFFCRVMNCWGWATWADRWDNFEKNPQGLIDKWSVEQKNHFDLDGSGVFWHQVTANSDGKINTWAIFWYATLYGRGGLCLNASQSYVDNIGHDGSGMHCGKEQAFLTTTRPALCNKTELILPIVINESTLAIRRIKNQMNNNLFQKIWKRVFKLIFGV